MQLAQQLRAYRERHGLTQQDIASFCYVTKATVSKWENGLSTPDVALLPLLASRFGTTVDALIGYEATRSKEDVRTAYARYATRFQHKRCMRRSLKTPASITAPHFYYSNTPFYSSTTRPQVTNNATCTKQRANGLLAILALLVGEPERAVERRTSNNCFKCRCTNTC